MTEEADESPESETTEGLDSADAFALLSDSTRLRILTALHEGPMGTSMQFSDLYDRVDVGDSAQFNYHLKRLVPHFVAKADGGYELTAAGRRLARAVTAGTYTDSPELDPFDIRGPCYACGESALRASYESETFAIDCGDCGEEVLRVQAPPTVVRGRDPEAVVDAFDRWARMQVKQAQRGICPNCGGAVDRSVTEDVRDEVSVEALAVFECTACGRRAVTSFGGLAYQSPPVEEFHRRRGESHRDRPYWEVPQYVAGDRVDVVSRDPWLVRVSFFAGGDACHVELDGSLEVIKAEIVPGETPDERD